MRDTDKTILSVARTIMIGKKNELRCIVDQLEEKRKEPETVAALKSRIDRINTVCECITDETL